MDLTKHCCRIFPIVLLLISVIIGLGIWYFNDGPHTFSFLFKRSEIFNFLGTILFIALLPIGIFYLATEQEKYRNNAKKLALLGFLPAIVFLLITVF